MRWFKKLKDLCQPELMQELDMAELSLALNSPTIRNQWLESVFLELRDLNLSVDSILDKREYTDLLELSIRRTQTVSLLRLIGSTRNSVELEAHQNHEQIDVVAVNQAPGQ